jgi:transcriptional regulator with XRE-family HTH domain
LKANSDRVQVDYQALGKRISAKRVTEGLALREAAERCGVSYSTLSRLERGVASPDFETLQQVLAWLDIPPSSLFMGAQPIRAHLRAQKNLASPVAEALAEVARVAQAQYYQSVPDECGDATASARTDRPRSKLRRALREEFAVRLRKSINYDIETPLDPFDLEVTGVQVKRLDEVAGIPREVLRLLLASHRSAWSAVTLPIDDAESAWIIILNSAHTMERQRATLMEEICHILLGHNLTTISHIEGQSFRDYNSQQENDAYGLGAAILVPKTALLRRIERCESAPEIAKHFGVSQKLVEYRIKVTSAWYQYQLRQHVKTRQRET